MYIKLHILSVLLKFFCIQCVLSLQCPDGWQQSAIDTQKCYLVVANKTTWQEAEQFCQRTVSYSHLTSVLSAFETNSMIALIQNNPSIGANDHLWIGAKGANNDQTFAWTDGKQVDYTNWQNGQPDIAQQCVSSLVGSTGKWRTERCETNNAFICEYYFTTTPSDCYDLRFLNGITSSGIYQLYPPGIDPFPAYCDMISDGGGWTVFQTRQDNTTVFWNRPWADYKGGFASDSTVLKNSWLGLDRIHVLSTKDENVTMRIELWGNRCNETGEGSYCGGRPPIGPDGFWFGEWPFSIEDEAHMYRLHVAYATRGNLSNSDDNSDSMNYNDNQPFTTVDRDNAHWNGGNCASWGNHSYGAWWLPNFCGGGAFLNGGYNPPYWGYYGFAFSHNYDNNRFWINPNQSAMKLRRNPPT